MRADVILSEDTTTLYVRWEVVVESGEADRLARLRGPLTLRLASSAYVDDGGRFHEHVDVDVLIHPHAGRRNRGQAKFRDPEARRRFVENLQEGVTADVAAFLWNAGPDADAADATGTVIERAEWTAGR